eukprot:6200943-Pleurochrysis_carterae.AAC.1
MATGVAQVHKERGQAGRGEDSRDGAGVASAVLLGGARGLTRVAQARPDRPRSPRRGRRGGRRWPPTQHFVVDRISREGRDSAPQGRANLPGERR